MCMTPHLNRSARRFVLKLAAAAALALPLAGCLGGEEFQRGYLLDERAVMQVKKGMSGEQVLQTLGTPSTVSTVGNKSWYYISQVSKRTFQFMGENVVDQRVTAVYFDKGLRVERVALYGLQDGKVFDFITRTTPTGGQETSFIGQIMKGDTKYNPL
jgi:outer membrane protein assembly factor BamE (lipoprotein component of BamABCDE complex)